MDIQQFVFKHDNFIAIILKAVYPAFKDFVLIFKQIHQWLGV
jgi:hypothetical protein